MFKYLSLEKCWPPVAFALDGKLVQVSVNESFAFNTHARFMCVNYKYELNIQTNIFYLAKSKRM